MTKPSRQRKRQIIAPLHIKQKQVRVHLSKELRKKYNKRALQARKDDVVRVITGKYKGKEGKIIAVNVKKGYLNIENLKIKKIDGKEIYVKVDPSNVILKEVSLNDNKRFKEKKKAEKKPKAKVEKKEIKKEKKQESKMEKKVEHKESQTKTTPKDPGKALTTKKKKE
jgi:large subunit ribosomal protein L24